MLKLNIILALEMAYTLELRIIIIIRIIYTNAYDVVLFLQIIPYIYILIYVFFDI